MLTAKLDGQAITLLGTAWDDQEAALRQASREGRLTAPCCGHPLVVKWGLRTRRHFAHWPRAHCPYDRWSEPESPEHVAGKALLYQWCQRHFGEQLRQLALEYPLAETLQRPDLYLELTDGTRMVLEYQRSPISLKEWTERHQGYQSQGLIDIWILGENRLQDALPSAEQQERWSRQEPRMSFLDLRAFENAAALRTPYDIPWWRLTEQEELWHELELAARTGRELSPWYRRSALERLRSITFLDATTGRLHIYRGMRELRGHKDTRVVSHVQQISLEEAGLELTGHGFVTWDDRQQLDRQARVRRVESAQGAASQVAEAQAVYQTAVPDQADPEALQRRWLEERAANPEWRSMVDRLGLRPANLFFLVGIPIPGDTVITVHRSVWQAYIYYRLVMGRHRGSFPVRWVRGHLERRFGFDPELVRLATLIMPGQVHGPDDVIGTYLNLLAATGYLRNEQQSQHFRYHYPVDPPPPLAFKDRSERHRAWEGLLAGRLTLVGQSLVGHGPPFELGPVR